MVSVIVTMCWSHLLVGDPQQPATAKPQSPYQVYAVELPAVDLDRSIRFYQKHFGFEIQSRVDRSNGVIMRSGSARVILRRADRRPSPSAPYVNLNFFVDHLDSTISRLKDAGVEFIDGTLEKISIGRAIKLRDPAGNELHLLTLDWENRPPAPTPRVFNAGMRFTDLGKAESFYCDTMGFEVSSRDYLPKTLPLNRSGHISLVLHLDAAATTEPDVSVPAPLIVLQTDNLDDAIRALKAKGVTFQTNSPRKASWGRYVTLSDPQGHALRLAQLFDSAP